MIRATGAFLAALTVVHILASPAYCQLPTVEEASASEILAVVRSGGSSVTIVNFWATWCIPCREEFPAYVRLSREYQPESVRMIFVSADFPEDAPEARQFLAKYGVVGRTYMKSGNDATFINAFSKGWSGALPATALLDRDGTLIDFWEGRTSYESLKQRVTRVLSTASQRE